MKIWIDILTPKQVLFFEPLINRLKKKHNVLVTYRAHRETSALITKRHIEAKLVGNYGGETLEGKLDSSLSRIDSLVQIIDDFKPKLAISSCSPDCAFISFKLGIKHYGYSNTPNAEKAMKLSIPLLTKLFTPSYIPKSQFTKFGIAPKNIITYNSMDEYSIIKNKSVLRDDESYGKNIILIRTVEYKASYKTKEFHLVPLVKLIHGRYGKEYEIFVLPRYLEEINYLFEKLRGFATVIIDPIDSGAILEKADLFIGSGGTMTTEAVLRGTPTISMNTAPNYTEKFLVNNGLLKRSQSYIQILNSMKIMLTGNTMRLTKQRAKKVMSRMEDPHNEIMRLIK